jgi:hypothetical protein
MSTNFLDQIKAAENAKLRALASLHTELGYSSAQALADAILRASSGGGAVVRGSATAKIAGSGNSRKGRRIPDTTRQAIAAALKAGEVGSGLSAKFGVSYNIIHAIKQELGMVKATKRSKKKKG